MEDIPLVSLFSGGGGLDYGLARAGFSTRLAVEMEPYACATLTKAQQLGAVVWPGHRYLEETHIFQGDIAQLTDADALRLARLAPGEALLLAGGPPCVTFSIAGKREGLGSEVGRLYTHYVRLLRAFRPQAFIYENVKGLLTATDEDGTNGGAFRVVLAALEDAGYATAWRLVDAADYGVPQHRHRVIIIGRRGTVPFRFPDQTHARAEGGRLPLHSPWRTVRDALAGLPPAVELGRTPAVPNHVARRHSETTKEGYRQTAPGKRNDAYKRDRLHWDEPAKAIRAQGKLKSNGSGQRNSSHQNIHPEEPRQLTPRECARLQTFPDWYPFDSSLVNAYRIIGDAVPCDLATVLGEAILDQLHVHPHADVMGSPRPLEVSARSHPVGGEALVEPVTV